MIRFIGDMIWWLVLFVLTGIVAMSVVEIVQIAVMVGPRLLLNSGMVLFWYHGVLSEFGFDGDWFANNGPTVVIVMALLVLWPNGRPTRKPQSPTFCDDPGSCGLSCVGGPLGDKGPPGISTVEILALERQKERHQRARQRRS